MDFKTDWLYTKFHKTAGISTAWIQGWSEKEKDHTPWKECYKDINTTDVSTVASAHTGWVKWGPGWQVLIYFREEKGTKELEILKLELRL